jgi:hypothetical protein
MAKIIRTLLVAGASAVFLLVVNAGSIPPTQPDRGQEWLSWSPAERNVYIDGFVTGYQGGTHRGCEVADELFEVGKPHRLGNQPSARCFARLETYSKYSYKDSADFTAYTTVITEFYTKHPEYRGVPFFYLLSFLSDRQFKTADELYQMALKGELRTNF